MGDWWFAMARSSSELEMPGWLGVVVIVLSFMQRSSSEPAAGTSQTVAWQC